jgi:molybdate transport system substrate-binding protein
MIAVPADNPAGVTSLADLTREELNVVICAPEVPCGRATGRVEALSGLDIVPDSEEQNVTDVLNKVVAGEADAGMVYVTDVINAGETEMGIEFPSRVPPSTPTRSPPSVGAGDEQLAEEFVQLVLGRAAGRCWESAGFGAPGRTADGTGCPDPGRSGLPTWRGSPLSSEWPSCCSRSGAMISARRLGGLSGP